MADTIITSALAKVAQYNGSETPVNLGRQAVSMTADANKTLLATEYDKAILTITSTVSLTATRDIIVPITSGAVWYVQNDTTGAQSIRVIGASGTSTVTIATAKGAWCYADGTNIRRMSADV